MFNTKVKAICFDYYGTLVDIGKPFEEIKRWFELQYYNQNLDINRFNWLFTKRRSVLLCGNGFKTGMKILTESYTFSCEKLQVESNTHEFEKMVTNIFTKAEAFQNAAQTISILKQRYCVGLVTNADNNLLHDSIRYNGFDFDFIISSEDAQCNKPNYEMFNRAMQITNLPAHKLLMIGDSIFEDILPAQKLGMKVIWLKRNNDEQTTFISINNIGELLNQDS